jgi:hypothetical protein
LLHRGHIENPKLHLRDRSVAAGITALASGALALLAEALRSETLMSPFRARCPHCGVAFHRRHRDA